jgi:hypothetical protein
VTEALPTSRTRVRLTLKQVWWGVVSGAVAVVFIAPLLGLELGLVGVCSVVLVTVAAFEVDHRGRLRVSSWGLLQVLAVIAGTAALLTFGTGALLGQPLAASAFAAALAALAAVVSVVVLRRLTAVFSPRHRVIEVI